MQTLHALYQQNSFWVWLAVGALFVALDIATGTGKLIWPGIAAAVVAFINLAGLRLGPTVEIALFVALSALGLALTLTRPKRRLRAKIETSGEKRAAKSEKLEAPSAERTGRLIGRIGRTTCEFANGVGRVWIDGSEWGAEIESGDGALPPDTPVRVMGVTGGVRLRVRGLMN